MINNVSMIQYTPYTLVLIGGYLGLLTSVPIGPSHILCVRACLLQLKSEKSFNLRSVFQNPIIIAAFSGLIAAQIIIFSSIYFESLYFLWVKPYLWTVILWPYTLSYFTNILVRTQRKRLSRTKSKVLYSNIEDLNDIRKVFLNTFLGQIINPILLTSPVFTRLITVYLFRYSHITTFVVGSLLGAISGQFLFLLMIYSLFLQLERTVPLAVDSFNILFFKVFNYLAWAIVLIYFSRTPIPVFRKTLPILNISRIRLRDPWPSLLFDSTMWYRPFWFPTGFEKNLQEYIPSQKELHDINSIQNRISYLDKIRDEHEALMEEKKKNNTKDNIGKKAQSNFQDSIETNAQDTIKANIQDTIEANFQDTIEANFQDTIQVSFQDNIDQNLEDTIDQNLEDTIGDLTLKETTNTVEETEQETNTPEEIQSANDRFINRKRFSEFFFRSCLSAGTQRLSHVFPQNLSIILDGIDTGLNVASVAEEDPVSLLDRWTASKSIRREVMYDAIFETMAELDKGTSIESVRYNELKSTELLELEKDDSAINVHDLEIFEQDIVDELNYITEDIDPRLSKNLRGHLLDQNSPLVEVENFIANIEKDKSAGYDKIYLNNNNQLREWIVLKCTELNENLILPWELFNDEARSILPLVLTNQETNDTKKANRKTYIESEESKDYLSDNKLSWEMFIHLYSSPVFYPTLPDPENMSGWEHIFLLFENLYKDNIENLIQKLKNQDQKNEVLFNKLSTLVNIYKSIPLLTIQNNAEVKHVDVMADGRKPVAPSLNRGLVLDTVFNRRRKIFMLKNRDKRARTPLFFRFQQRSLNIGLTQTPIKKSSFAKTTSEQQRALWQPTKKSHVEYIGGIMQRVRGPILIAQVYIRKYIKLPLLIALKNCGRFLLLQKTEFYEDLKDWSHEVYVYCEYDGSNLKEKTDEEIDEEIRKEEEKAQRFNNIKNAILNKVNNIRSSITYFVDKKLFTRIQDIIAFLLKHLHIDRFVLSQFSSNRSKNPNNAEPDKIHIEQKQIHIDRVEAVPSEILSADLELTDTRLEQVELVQAESIKTETKERQIIETEQIEVKENIELNQTQNLKESNTKLDDKKRSKFARTKPDEWWSEGLQVKIFNPFRLRPWRLSNNELVNYYQDLIERNDDFIDSDEIENIDFIAKDNIETTLDLEKKTDNSIIEINSSIEDDAEGGLEDDDFEDTDIEDDDLEDDDLEDDDFEDDDLQNANITTDDIEDYVVTDDIENISTIENSGKAITRIKIHSGNQAINRMLSMTTQKAEYSYLDPFGNEIEKPFGEFVIQPSFWKPVLKTIQYLIRYRISILMNKITNISYPIYRSVSAKTMNIVNISMSLISSIQSNIDRILQFFINRWALLNLRDKTNDLIQVKELDQEELDQEELDQEELDQHELDQEESPLLEEDEEIELNSDKVINKIFVSNQDQNKYDQQILSSRYEAVKNRLSGSVFEKKEYLLDKELLESTDITLIRKIKYKLLKIKIMWLDLRRKLIYIKKSVINFFNIEFPTWIKIQSKLLPVRKEIISYLMGKYIFEQQFYCEEILLNLFEDLQIKYFNWQDRKKMGPVIKSQQFPVQLKKDTEIFGITQAYILSKVWQLKLFTNPYLSQIDELWTSKEVLKQDIVKILEQQGILYNKVDQINKYQWEQWLNDLPSYSPNQNFWSLLPRQFYLIKSNTNSIDTSQFSAIDYSMETYHKVLIDQTKNWLRQWKWYQLMNSYIDPYNNLKQSYNPSFKQKIYNETYQASEYIKSYDLENIDVINQDEDSIETQSNQEIQDIILNQQENSIKYAIKPYKSKEENNEKYKNNLVNVSIDNKLIEQEYSIDSEEEEEEETAKEFTFNIEEDILPIPVIENEEQNINVSSLLLLQSTFGNTWKEEQIRAFINFISSDLTGTKEEIDNILTKPDTISMLVLMKDLYLGDEVIPSKIIGNPINELGNCLGIAEFYHKNWRIKNLKQWMFIYNFISPLLEYSSIDSFKTKSDIQDLVLLLLNDSNIYSHPYMTSSWVPEDIMPANINREFRILELLNLNTNYDFSNKLQTSKQVIKNSLKSNNQKSISNQQPSSYEIIKRFLWPTHRLEDLACINRFWLGTNTHSKFSTLRISMYPFLKQ